MWVQCKEDKARSSSRRHRSLPAPLRNLLPLSVKQLSLLLPRAAMFCPALDALSKTSRGKRKETNSVGAPMICQMLPNMLPFNAHCIVPKALLLLYYVVESKTQSCSFSKFSCESGADQRLVSLWLSVHALYKITNCNLIFLQWSGFPHLN